MSPATKFPKAKENEAASNKPTVKTVSSKGRSRQNKTTPAVILPAQELNEETRKIEQIKRDERLVISPQEFENARKTAMDRRADVHKGDDFVFKASKVGNKRVFNVKGLADPTIVYRGAQMQHEVNGKKVVVYFFSQHYDTVMGMHDNRILSVLAWFEEKKGKYNKTPVTKNELKSPVAMDWQEVQKICEKIKKQGLNPFE